MATFKSVVDTFLILPEQGVGEEAGPHHWA